MKKKTGEVYQFKITLDGVDPPIWRRIQVPAGYSFWDLHVAIQDAMGWLDCHLHGFQVINPETRAQDLIGIPSHDGMGAPFLAGWETFVADYFDGEGVMAGYEYDFGDGWQHVVVLEKVLPRPKGKRYPVCVGGERACPPEDCGGVWGYEEFLKAISDPSHEEHDSMLEWVGGRFDSEEFDGKKVRFDNPRRRREIAFGCEERRVTPKIAETIWVFAEPFVDMMEPEGEMVPSRLQSVLTLPVMAWNCVVLADTCGNARYLKNVRQLLKNDPPFVADLFERLVIRKRTEFASDHRLIGECEVYESKDNDICVRATAYEPSGDSEESVRSGLE